MDQILKSPVLIGLLIVSLIVYFSNHLLKPKYDPKEPPVIPQKLPYIGHLTGFLLEGFTYYKKVSAKHKLPIYTLQMLSMKIYVVNSPDVAVAVLRNSKNLLFSPMLAAVIPRVFDVGDDVASVVRKHMRGSDGEWANTHPMNMANYVQMLPGPNLDSMVRKVQRQLNPFMNQLQEQSDSDEDTVVGLFAWTKKHFGLATTEAIYGRENPFKLQPKMLDAFWEMDEGFTLLMIRIMPKLIARKAYQARQQLFDGMNTYFASNWRDDACELIKARYDSFKECGLSVDTIARFEVGDSIAIMVNTVPTVFWVLNYIYMDSSLLEEIRAEITTILSTTTDERTGTKTTYLSSKSLQEHCNLLVSTYQEVLRLQTNNASARWVVKDTLISDQYLLKKDSVVQIPSEGILQDPATWGPDVLEFNPRRFLKGEPHLRKSETRPGAVLATLCPGRHFATAEIISFVAMFVLRFDLTPINYGWRKPLVEVANILTSVPAPSSDILVRVKTREGFEKDVWEFADAV